MKNVKRLWGIALILSSACALPKAPPVAPTAPVWVRSHNRQDVDVYLLCGNRDAIWLGVVGAHGQDVLEFPSTKTRCVAGLNFFLIPRGHNRGYWVGPLHPRRGDSPVELVIEKYAGLSTAHARWDLP
jgi:hypothetical protein